MQASDNVKDDLGYVRGVLERAGDRAAPPSIWYLWAAISAIGFPLIDIRPQWVPLFWMIAAPLGFILSAILGWRHGRASGQESRREGTVHMLHWGACTVACFLLVPLARVQGLSGEALAQAILVVVALGYFLAGVHLARPLLWVGLLIAGGYGIVLMLEGPVWTAVGLLISLALVVTAFVTGRSRD